MNNTIKKAISMVLATSFTITMANTFMSINSNAQDGTTEPIKIMCVGDSITDGYGLQGSYRKYLYQNLTESNFNIDMVGAYGNDSESYYNTTDGSTIDYDGNYTAVSGYAIQQMTSGEYRNGIYETIKDGNVMENCQPDIVLLQIGTNDIISNYNDGIINRLENLVDYLIENMSEDGTVFVTTIPYMDANNNEVYSWFSHYDDYYQISQEELAQEIIDCIDSYNTQIKEMVSRKQSEGCKNIQFADVNSVVDYKTELRDGVHPNDEGYQDMGEYWGNLLASYFSGDSGLQTENTSETPEITTITEDTSETSETTTTTEDTSETSEITTTTEPPQVTYPIGDINYDGQVSSIDLLMLKKSIFGVWQPMTIMGSNSTDTVNDNWSAFDLNSDNNIDVLDIIKLKSILLK